jgi:hypothetical protein
MDRMGHSTTRAALIYLHRTSERDRAIADAMGELAKTGLKPASPSGTQHFLRMVQVRLRVDPSGVSPAIREAVRRGLARSAAGPRLGPARS